MRRHLNDKLRRDEHPPQRVRWFILKTQPNFNCICLARRAAWRTLRAYLPRTSRMNCGKRRQSRRV